MNTADISERPIMFKDATAARLADCLEAAAREPDYTGGLSMLDEATLAFQRISPEIAAAQKAFGEARSRHHRRFHPQSPDPGQLEADVVAAARELARLLRPLGDHQIARCRRPAGHGTCGMPLDDERACRSPLGHADENQ